MGEAESNTDDSDSDEKPTPPVPPSNHMEIPEKRKGSRVVDREFVQECDCGGKIYDEQVKTGRMMVATWDPEMFDQEKYKLSTEYEQTEGRARCERCGVLYTY